MEIKIDVSKDNLGYAMSLGLAGCLELLDYPELCFTKNTKWEDKYRYDRKDSSWYEEATVVHALAYKGHAEILNYPQYLKIKNKNGVTPLHLLVQSFIPNYYRRGSSPLTPEISKVLDKVLLIDGLTELKGHYDQTPLHFMGELGYVPMLDYPGVGSVQSPEYNAHGTPLTQLYYYACEGLDRLLREDNILTEYINHGSPLEALAFNKVLRPTVGVLRKHKFKMTNKNHSSKKLTTTIARDIVNNVPQAIRFIKALG